MNVTPADLATDFDGAMRTLETAVSSDDPVARAAAFEVLRDTVLPDMEDPSRVVRLVEDWLLQPPEDSGDVALHCIEFWLNRSMATPELRPRLEALAMRQIYRGSHGQWASIAQVVGQDAHDPDRDALGLGRMRERLLRAMLISSRDYVDDLPEVIVTNAARGRWTIDVLLNAPDNAWRRMERGLVVATSYNSDWFAPRLADAIRRRRYVPNHPRLRRFVELVQAGCDPPLAIQRAANEPL